jgi:hypothetical protein
MVRCPPSPFETRFALLRMRAGFSNHAPLLRTRTEFLARIDKATSAPAKVRKHSVVG